MLGLVIAILGTYKGEIKNDLFLNENNDKNNRRVIDDFINQLKTKF